MTNYLRTAVSPSTQLEQARADQVQNSAGGFVFALDDWSRLRRFLVLGSEGGTYYASERKLTRENAQVVEKLVTVDGLRLVNEVAELSESGRAPKNDPAILALALAAKCGDAATRAAALTALPRVCRTGTHLYHFADFISQIGGWGRATRRAVANWFNSKTPDQLAYQLIKYQQRDGWSARDVLRVCHAKPAQPQHDALFRWVTGRNLDADQAAKTASHAEAYKLPRTGKLPAAIVAFEELQSTTNVDAAVSLIRDFELPRECVPTKLLTLPAIWEALLPHMGLTAMIRNLATMTRVGLLAPLTDNVATVCRRITDAAELTKARVHPIQLLSALRTYAQGHGERGGNTWTPVQKIVDALDTGFYASFGAVHPTGKPTLLALDVSGSMCGGTIAGVPGLTPREASAAMALVTAAREPNYHIMGFSHQLVDVPITPRMRIDEACHIISRIPMGSTDCALPMLWAMRQPGIKVESFAVYTDNETWAGEVHPFRALQNYRQARGVNAKLAVIGLTATGFTIADPSDAGMMDFVGFDAAAPALMSDFFGA